MEWELCNRGRVDAPVTDAALLPVPVPFTPLRLVWLFEFCEEERVVGGEDLSNQELSVDEDLLFLGRSIGSPSLLEFPDEVPF